LVRRKSKGRGRRARSATKRHAQRSKHTTVTIETHNRGSKRTTVYEEVYEQEW
jgi:hypothetical protein